MKQKLTKNDSMPVEKISFDVLTAAFDAMLSRNDIRLDYYAIWAKKHPVMYGSTLYKEWQRWAKLNAPNDWTSRAFNFFDTNIPARVWVSMHEQWIAYLKENLKK